MQFSSWNINGLRAVTNKGYFPAYITDNHYDLIFLMETKCEIDQLSESVLSIPSYQFTLQPSGYKKGYAGVALYTHSNHAMAVQTGFTHITSLTDEQRVMTASFTHPNHGRIAITGAYFPNGARGVNKRANGMGQSEEVQDNLEYKLDFFTEFLKHAEHLAQHHDHVFICGDINIAHHEIDLARPESNKKSIGFLPSERERLDIWEKSGWVDIFRHHYTDTVVYSWWDVISRARERNVGWRIDSWWCKKGSMDIVESVVYATDQMGSDHCPVILTLK